MSGYHDTRIRLLREQILTANIEINARKRFMELVADELQKIRGLMIWFEGQPISLDSVETLCNRVNEIIDVLAPCAEPPVRVVSPFEAVDWDAAKDAMLSRMEP